MQIDRLNLLLALAVTVAVISGKMFVRRKLRRR
jgi:hypothetical protein